MRECEGENKQKREAEECIGQWKSREKGGILWKM